MRDVFFFFMACFAVSCTPSALVPCAPQAPDLEAKHDASFSAQGNWDHAEFQTGYSPVKHMGLIGNSYFSFNGAKNWQAGAGYYTRCRKLDVDLFGAFGNGERRTDESWAFLGSGNVGKVRSRFYDLMLQGDCYGHINERTTFTLSLQYTYFHLHDFSYSYTTDAFSESHWTAHNYKMSDPDQHLLVASCMVKDYLSDYFSLFIQPGIRFGFPFHSEVDSYTRFDSNDPPEYLPDSKNFLGHSMCRAFINAGLCFRIPGSVWKKTTNERTQNP